MFEAVSSRRFCRAATMFCGHSLMVRTSLLFTAICGFSSSLPNGLHSLRDSSTVNRLLGQMDGCSVEIPPLLQSTDDSATPAAPKSRKIPQVPRRKKKSTSIMRTFESMPGPSVWVVRSPQEARRAVEKLLELTSMSRVHAVCVQAKKVAEDPKETKGARDAAPRRSWWVSGEIQAVSFHCGCKIDGEKATVYLDNTLDKHTLLEFKPYFANKAIPKVYHDYGASKAMLGRYFLSEAYEKELTDLFECDDSWHQNFHGDIVHMARLLDSTRGKSSIGYTLESITELSSAHREVAWGEVSSEKTAISMPKELYRFYLEHCEDDSELLYRTYNNLKELMRDKPSHLKGKGAHKNLWEFYERHWRPFGEVLTQMEMRGMYVDRSALEKRKKALREDVEKLRKMFCNRVTLLYRKAAQSGDLKKNDVKLCELQYLNNRSLLQMKRLLFDNGFQELGSSASRATGKTASKTAVKFWGLGLSQSGLRKTRGNGISMNAETISKILQNPTFDEGSKFRQHKHEVCDVIKALKEVNEQQRLEQSFFRPLPAFVVHSRIHASLNVNTKTGRLSCVNPNLQNLPTLAKDRLKLRACFLAPPGKVLIVADYSQVELRVLTVVSKCQSLAQDFKDGVDVHSKTAYILFPEIQEAVKRKKVCIDSPNEGPVCSPTRKQSLPTIKDVFPDKRKMAKTVNFAVLYGQGAAGLAKLLKVTSEEAKRFLADWKANREDVWKWKGTVLDEAGATGEVCTLLGRPVTAALLKKTASSGASDAHEAVPLLQESRTLPVLWTGNSRRSWTQSLDHARRAAVNAVVQGSAADLVMLAMVHLSEDVRLHTLGARLVMQVHDELIFEVPKENAEEAKGRIQTIMEKPNGLPSGIEVDFPVDLKVVRNWGEAK
eukprot:RCo006842